MATAALDVSTSDPPGLLVLAIDTATHASLVALGRSADDARPSRRDAAHRHGSLLVEQIEALLATSGQHRSRLELVAVGTGPGSFSGLRVGLATAKTLAYVLAVPIVGVASTDALRRAAVDVAGAPTDAAVVLPAGARDHYLALPGQDAGLVPPGRLGHEVGERSVIGVDIGPDILGLEAARLGAAAVEGLARALLAMALERYLKDRADDVAMLAPAYVALPRGLTWTAEEVGWSPDLR